MSKTWILLTTALLLGSAGALRAYPAAVTAGSPTTQDEVAAALVASAIPVSNNGASDRFRGAEKAVSASQNDADGLVALLMARSDINSVSDLANKDIAIDDKISASSAGVRAAITTAGATAARLSEGHAETIDRLVDGKVEAVVLALVSPEAAEWFPEIEGFRIFRIPLPAHAEKALR
jgi:TRAP-type uncharacterized transport system substrate-binding protein